MKRIFYVFMLLLVALSACKNGKQEVVQDEPIDEIVDEMPKSKKNRRK